MTRQAAHIDLTHKAIRDGLRQVGFVVVDMANKGEGFPDLVVINPVNGKIGLIEAKTFENMRADKIEQEVKFMLKLVTESYRMIEDPQLAINEMRKMLL
jgi:hypothetical protein